jgi:NAD(P)-dependent dehydrogenase (short-subunit alcohol dehydrogenase family)
MSCSDEYARLIAFETASYAASKGAAVMLTRQVALDYGRDRIHCNALCPGCKSTLLTFTTHLFLYDIQLPPKV